MPRKKKKITLAPMVGDHGTGTAAAMVGTVLEPLVDEGTGQRDPNNRGRRYRKDVYKAINLTMRQEQAAKLLRDAYCRVDALSSGGPLKERVQASSKPDATIDMQVGAMSQLVRLTSVVLRSDRQIVEHILRDNLPGTQLGRKGVVRWSERFKQTMDRVADKAGY